MVKNEDELRACMAGSEIASARMCEVSIPGNAESAIVAEVSGQDVWPWWQQARDALPETGRWPVVSAAFSGSQWPQCVYEAGLIGREEYGYDAEQGADVSPQAVIARSRAASSAQLIEEALVDNPDVFEDEFDYEGDEYLRGYVPAAEPTFVVFLPTRHSWQTLAYMYFWGSGNAEAHLALLASWEERFEAELVAHYGTMLHFSVGRPPADLSEALGLAREQVAAAPCTTFLPGVGLTAHAKALVGRRRWFLHERP